MSITSPPPSVPVVPPAPTWSVPTATVVVPRHSRSGDGDMRERRERGVAALRLEDYTRPWGALADVTEFHIRPDEGVRVVAEVAVIDREGCVPPVSVTL